MGDLDLFHAGHYRGLPAGVAPGLSRATARLAASRYTAASCTTPGPGQPPTIAGNPSYSWESHGGTASRPSSANYRSNYRPRSH
jgi:hypothetical protein